MSEGETSAGVGLVSSHLPPNFSQVPASWSYCRCVMKREIPVWNKSDLHSAGVMICVDWPHSPACKNIPLFTSKQAKGGGGLARVWIERSSSSWPPGRRRSGLLKSALDSEPVFRRQLPHSQRDARADQVVPASTSHRARSAPAGETGAGPATCLWETNHRGYRRGDQEKNGISSAFTCADGFRGCFDPWPSLSNKYHRSRGNTIIRSRQGRPFVGGVRSR